MNVLFVVPWDQKSGGVASVVGNLAKFFQTLNRTVIFVHPSLNNLAQMGTTELGFPGYKLRLRAPSVHGHTARSILAFFMCFPLTFVQLIYVVMKHHIQMINIHYPSEDFIYFVFLRLLMPLKLVISIHGADFFPGGKSQKKYSRTIKVLLRFCDCIVAPSNAFLCDFLSLFPDLKRKSLFIHNAVDLSEFAAPCLQSKDETQRKKILSIAAHNEKKGLDVLLRAFLLVSNRKPRLDLLLAGDGPLRPQLEELAKTLKIDSQVKFLGYQQRDQITRLLHECDLFVLPSRSEPFGIVVIEALACGKAIVASNVGGIAEIITNGENGILVDPDDPVALAQAIYNVLDDNNLRRKIEIRGYASVLERFTCEHNAKAYEKLFAELKA